MTGFENLDADDIESIRQVLRLVRDTGRGTDAARGTIRTQVGWATLDAAWLGLYEMAFSPAVKAWVDA